MIEQFSSKEYHDPIYDAGIRALDSLQKATSGENFADDVTSVSKILEQECELALVVMREDRARVIDDIHPEIIDADIPPHYLVSMIGSLSIALADHINLTHTRGHNQSFSPGPEWLDNHVNSLWFTHSRQMSDGYQEMDVLEIGNGQKINIVIAKDEDRSVWSIDYVKRKRSILERSPFKDDPVRVFDYSDELLEYIRERPL